MARNQNNVSEWSDMSTRILLHQRVVTIKIKFGVFVQYKAEIIISSKFSLFFPRYSCKQMSIRR